MHKVLDALREAGLSVWTDEGLEPGTQRLAGRHHGGSRPGAGDGGFAVAQRQGVSVGEKRDQLCPKPGKAGFSDPHRRGRNYRCPISIINTQWVDGRQRIDQAVRNELLPTLRIPLKESISRRPASGGAPPKSPRHIWLWLGVAAVLLAVDRGVVSCRYRWFSNR